jgi:hypothetical protein
MKNYTIAIEPVHRHPDDDGKPGYVKCYKLGGRWTWKSVATQAQASKFTHEVATWKCKSLNHPECPAFFFVEPLDS